MKGNSLTIALLATVSIATFSFAQPGATPGGPNPIMGQLFLIGSMVLIFYFLILRPQKKQQGDHKKMIQALKKGDRVLTSGGIYGTVLGVDEAKAVLKIADDTKVEFAKSAIVQVLVEEAK